MYIDYILTNIVKRVKDSYTKLIDESRFIKDKVLINSMSKDEELKLIELIIEFQSNCIKDAIENLEDYKIDYIGTFKISELRKLDIEFTKQYKNDNPNCNKDTLLEDKKKAVLQYYKAKPKVIVNPSLRPKGIKFKKVVK